MRKSWRIGVWASSAFAAAVVLAIVAVRPRPAAHEAAQGGSGAEVARAPVRPDSPWARVAGAIARRDRLSAALDRGEAALRANQLDDAAESFHSALAEEPGNQRALEGITAVETRRRASAVPTVQVVRMFEAAMRAFDEKRYAEAIETAEGIRRIKLPGNSAYLDEAKQIIDRARRLQREEFEPFLFQAKEKYAEGDYAASRELCDEMLKRDPKYEEAKKCSEKAKRKLGSLTRQERLRDERLRLERTNSLSPPRSDPNDE